MILFVRCDKAEYTVRNPFLGNVFEADNDGFSMGCLAAPFLMNLYRRRGGGGRRRGGKNIRKLKKKSVSKM